MAKNRVFFPQQALDEWLEDGRILVVDDEMTLKPGGQRYRLSSAIRIMAEVAEGTDPNDLVGKVKSVEAMTQAGGEHVSGSLVLGDNAYDVIDGFLGEPQDDAPHRTAVTGRSLASAARAAAGDKVSTDDADPLLRFLLGKP